ncbi:hypothetical protein BDQ12DRAFT_674553 [Crucibulum laeve]|uniref:Uncharacterized protein n=1 Tax=Crucibulum laeve TaxID=68775 RepID=A0A5C3MCX2_9AGAR|nr:hypothetical protein BDQ12DRAFT_674553 [Crucibulum laeve]
MTSVSRLTHVEGTLHDGLWIKKVASVYTASQVVRWLQHIKYVHSFTEDDIAAGRFPVTLENLVIITRLQLVTFPYENTEMHYSSDHKMDITPEGLYRRLILDNRGSYCFGLNGLFFQMLRGLGYRAYSGSARVNVVKDPELPPNFTALIHMIIFVQPIENSNETYLVDVGCGGSGPARPILLLTGGENVVMGISPTEKHRLNMCPHPESSLGMSSIASPI